MPFDGTLFTSIPILLRGGSFVNQDNSLAVGGLYTDAYKILVIGQKLATGVGNVNVQLQVASPGQAAALFGNNSMLHVMLGRVFDQGLNQGLQVWAIAVADLVGGTPAAGNVVVGGAPTQSGVIAFYVGGERVQVGVQAGQSTASIATAIQAAVAGINTWQYVTAAIDGANTSKVDFTALHSGLAYNGLDIRDSYFLGEALPAGLTLTYTAMAGGAGNPNIATVIAAMGATRFAKIAMPWLDGANLTALTNELTRRYGPTVQLEGVAHAWSDDTLSNLLTLGSSWNSPFLSIGGIQGAPAPGFALAARYTALAAAAAMIDPPRQLRTLVMADELPPVPTVLFTDDERENLLQDGIATWTINADGLMCNERAVTTYKTNAAGVVDPSERDVERMECLHAIRADIRGWVASAFPRWKLADDGPGITAGNATQTMTPNYMKACLQTRGLKWAQAGWIQDYNSFVASLNGSGGVVRDPNDVDRLDALIQPNLINNFRTFAVENQFIN